MSRTSTIHNTHESTEACENKKKQLANAHIYGVLRSQQYADTYIVYTVAPAGVEGGGGGGGGCSSSTTSVPAYVSIRQHTSAYFSIRQHTQLLLLAAAAAESC
jgi:hypothetical protein